MRYARSSATSSVSRQARSPTPEFAASVAEQFETLLAKLPEAELRQIARLRLEEYTTEEIAEQLGIAERTVRRKLVLIRSYWENDLSPP